MNNIIDRAQDFAQRAHDSIGQVRKYSGLPYWTHPRAVAALVEAHGGTPDMIAAAHLHDVLEDVAGVEFDHEFGLYAIRQAFGNVIARYVFALTDIFTHSAYPDMNREQRKLAEAFRLSWESSAVHSIKLADIIHNTSDIVANDHGFAPVYLKEAARLVRLLRRGHPELQIMAARQIVRATT